MNRKIYLYLWPGRPHYRLLPLAALPPLTALRAGQAAPLRLEALLREQPDSPHPRRLLAKLNGPDSAQLVRFWR